MVERQTEFRGANPSGLVTESIAIIGPTASGKTKKAVALAKRLNGEILSADSRQIYRGMTLGTGKDLEEYQGVPYHLIDICEAGEKYNLHRFLSDFHQTYYSVLNRNKLPVICGGSGMYVENALNGVKMPEVPANPVLREELREKTLDELTSILKRYKTLHNITDVDTVKRAVRAIEIAEYYRSHPEEALYTKRENITPLNALVIGLHIPREERRKSITARLQTRLDNGMLKEVENLLASGLSPDDLIYYGLEYKYLTLHLIGRLSYEEMFTSLETAIHQFAKRQMTWFRGMERRGFTIHWLPYNLDEVSFLNEVERLFLSPKNKR